ncbi:Carbamoyl-phosphate synthase L chain, ATP binding domain [Halomicrobium zhouii]|uniref:Carbamoyl-phosphate synthase L chain, ATP binding domain n=2 Tax=Halomicrobium zhouii TaxID=767519 RepID=A0A1I6KLF7_9EURY|nr:Carbamoyl-phosphate synthase L chain, ATP binding domain [Halomicrobium zhouii]
MVLDGDNDNAIQVATELSEDLDAEVVGVGTSNWSRLLRSRYCDVGVTTGPASEPGYADQLLDAVEAHRPDLLVPVGYHSVAAVDRIRDDLPDAVECWLPPSDSLDVAVDKVATAELAAELDVGTPTSFTDRVAALDERGRPGEVADLPFPLFLKARHECGKNVTAAVERPGAFWATYDDLVAERGVREVIVQECIPGERTYACGLLYDDGAPQLLFAHEELRSVPREGGSGTRVRLFRDPRIETAAIRLLDSLDWHGPALVEFKRCADGSYALMEINPKLWASYALASQAGYRFVSTCARRALGLDGAQTGHPPDATAEMVFPLRELYYAARTDDESLLRSAAAICWPPARLDLNLRDLGAWLTPPAAVVDTVDTATAGPSSVETSAQNAANGDGRADETDRRPASSEGTNVDPPPGDADESIADEADLPGD